MWKLKKKKGARTRDRQVNKFKNNNHTIVLCLSCVPFWNTAECEEVSHFNQLPQWKKSLFEDGLFPSIIQRGPKVFHFQSNIHLCTKKKKKIWNSSTMTALGHAQKQRALCLFFSWLLGLKPFRWIRRERIQSAGIAAFVLRPGFVSQLNPSSTKSGYNLETYIQYTNYNQQHGHRP